MAGWGYSRPEPVTARGRRRAPKSLDQHMARGFHDRPSTTFAVHRHVSGLSPLDATLSNGNYCGGSFGPGTDVPDGWVRNTRPPQPPWLRWSRKPIVGRCKNQIRAFAKTRRPELTLSGSSLAPDQFSAMTRSGPIFRVSPMPALRPHLAHPGRRDKLKMGWRAALHRQGLTRGWKPSLDR